jgi:AraC-like DNA-binding protein
LLLIRCIVEPDWMPVEVHFEHAAPRDVAELERVFGRTLHFQQATNGLVLRRELLDRIVRGADSRLYPILEQHIRNMLRQLPPADDFMLSVRHEVAKSLAVGNAHVDYLARQLGLGSRTLQRRLNEYGASYRSVLEDVRRELALRYLAESDISVTEVAFLLGYHDTSAFIRAFRRWTGVSPLAHRRRMLGSSNKAGSPLRSA